jgi:inorganic pyrophosphatase
MAIDSTRHIFQSHPWHGVSPGEDAPALVNAYIEIVPTDAVKYELDKASGHLRVDRPQRFSSMCPTLYGFIPQTLCGQEVAALCAQRTGREGIQGDRDPISACWRKKHLPRETSFCMPGRLVVCEWLTANRPTTIIAVLESDLAYGHIEDLDGCPQGLIDRLKHYFLSYKQLPGDAPKKVEIVGVYERAEALDVINRSLRDYRKEWGIDLKDRDWDSKIPPALCRVVLQFQPTG